MIIFYNKKTGDITGVIEGRIHSYQKNVWVGDKKEVGRIILEWKPTKKGYVLQHPQKDLILKFESDTSEIYKYKVDVKRKLFIKKDK